MSGRGVMLLLFMAAADAGIAPEVLARQPSDELIEAITVRPVNGDDGLIAHRWSEPVVGSIATECGSAVEDCVWYADLGWEDESFDVIIKLRRAADSLSLLGPGRISCRAAENAAATYHCRVDGVRVTEKWQTAIQFPDSSATARTLYFARRVRVAPRSSVAGCSGTQLCVQSDGSTDILLDITNFAEVHPDNSEEGRADLNLRSRPGRLTVTNTSGAVRLVLKTRRAYLNADRRWTTEYSQNLQLVTLATPIPLATFGEANAWVLVGEQMVVPVGFSRTVPDTVLLNRTLELRSPGEDGVVAYAQFLDSRTARITGVKPTARATRDGSAPLLNAYRQGAAATAAPDFAAQLQVREAPVVRRIVVQQLEAYADTLLHPGATSRVTLEGAGLDLYSGSFLEEARQELRPSMHSRSILAFDVAVPDNFRASSITVRLRSEYVADTLIQLAVGRPGRPRALDFGWIVTTPQGNLRTGPQEPPSVPRSTAPSQQQAQTSTAASGAVRRTDENPASEVRPFNAVRLDTAIVFNVSGHLRDIWLVFDPGLVDSGRLHGVQYLEVVAELSRSRFLERNAAEFKQVVALDTTWIAVAPATGAYEVSGGYLRANAISIDRLLGDVLRDAQPRSRLELTVRHDPRRYGSVTGHTAAVTVRDQRSTRWDFNLQLPSGLFTIAKVRENQRQILQNGAGTDTLISGRNAWDAALASMAGAASIDISNVRDDGRPGRLRGRFSLYYLQSPFVQEKRHRFALAAQYPLHLFSAGFLQASIAMGPTCLVEPRMRCFFILAPGFTVGEAK